MKSEVYERKVETGDELFACVLDAAACIKKRQEELRRTTRHLLTLFAKYIEVDVGTFECLFEIQQICPF